MKAPPADPAVVDKLRATFERISGDDMEIDAYELKDILNAAYGNGEFGLCKDRESAGDNAV